MNRICGIVLTLILLICATSCKKGIDSLSGIYPHLANYNDEEECGTGALVPFADRLWIVTYGPHKPYGSSDKLIEISPDLKRIERKESIGGTPANRMIHKESEQLFIGPYAIDKERNVRSLSYEIAPGRYTGTARHLTDPVNKIYIGTMEEGFYEVNVSSLETTTLYPDGNTLRKEGQMFQTSPLLPGVHGKGLYSGQGVLVYSNNGEDTEEALRKFDVESGSLCEWDGKEWKMIRRNQFVEVTGPGGIYGNPCPATDPIWVTGWDHKSVIVGTRDPEKGWTFFRLPKASHSYDGAHGWNTEWPRIRNVGTIENPDYLMTMHGLFWQFPSNFSTASSGGIRPRSAYLKVIGDFTRWNDQLVFGCDDAAVNGFLNKRKFKGNAGPGQSNSNIWFTPLRMPDELGPSTADGSVWEKEDVKANVYSEPFLFSGWDYRCCWLKNESPFDVTFTLQLDKDGNNAWIDYEKVTVGGNEDLFLPFSSSQGGEWIRVKTNKDSKATVSFSYTKHDIRNDISNEITKGLASIKTNGNTGGMLYSLGDNRRSLGLLANVIKEGKQHETGYYEMGEELKLVRKSDVEMSNYIRTNFAIPKQVVTIDSASVLILDDRGRRWRLPLGLNEFRKKTNNGLMRLCREVVTERDLFSCMGTYYELPAENADGFAKIRPISTHNFQINDYCSYRGMLILTGININEAKGNPHIIISDDRKAAVWAGTIDDLWKFGSPRGEGGPWKNSLAKNNFPSDPYLIGFYNRKELSLSHKGNITVTFKVEADPTGNGDWMVYENVRVKPGEIFNFKFPESFQARWIRFTTDSDVIATAWLKYE